MNLGLPYKGSKNTIAEDLVKCLPRGKKLLDACCGGGAVLMAAAMSGRWEKVVGNDLNPATIALLDAVLIHKGQIEYEHPPVCTRDDFANSLQRIENGNFTIQDCVNKYCASFGNDGKTYLYGKQIEEYKLVAEQMLTADTLDQRRKFYRKFHALINTDDSDDKERLQKLESMQRLQSLERLERLERLDIFNIDYKEFDVVYFDIPYKGTNKYDFEFDYEKFYDLFKSLKTDLKINAFLSEYDAPFTCVAEFEKTQLMAASVGATKKTSKERLFYNGSPAEYRDLMGSDYAPKVEQTALF
jgi:site-specific DNA-adenine methylase